MRNFLLQLMRIGTVFSIIILTLYITSCSTYNSKPLSNQVTLLSGVPQIPSENRVFEEFCLDTPDELDITKISVLAAIYNPDLRLARDDLGISHAQVFSSHLPPDPIINLSKDFPSNGPPGTVIAYVWGLTYDFKSLVLLPGNIHIAKADCKKVYLNLLWQERQIINRARLLYVKIIYQEKQLKVLKEAQVLWHDQYVVSQEALKQGNSTMDVTGSKLASLQDINRQIYDLTLLMHQNRYDLNALLGLEPAVMLILSGLEIDSELNSEEISDMIPDILTSRPDLLALKAGYEAQDARFRQSILAQFPSLNVGVRKTRDNTDINMVGFAIDISIPIFNGNRGNIAIEDATRQKLYDEYQLRYNIAYGEIQRLLLEEPILLERLNNVQQSLIEFGNFAARADIAYREKILDVVIYTNLQQALVNKKIEEIAVYQALAEQRIALQTLVGYPLFFPENLEDTCTLNY